MWSGIATKEQAERMVKENLLDEKAFWAPYGVRTLSKYEKMYVVKPSGNPSCWLGPIWGISNYMVFRGLVKYGFLDEAKMLAEKTVKLLETDLINSGELHEYYDPEKGTPIINPGFQNWNLLSLNMLAWLKGENVVEEF
jgi:putative isomerase